MKFLLRILGRIGGLFLCMMGMHDWTSKALQGIRPTKEQLENPKKGFWEYSLMYCSRCNKKSELNQREAKP